MISKQFFRLREITVLFEKHYLKRYPILIRQRFSISSLCKKCLTSLVKKIFLNTVTIYFYGKLEIVNLSDQNLGLSSKKILSFKVRHQLSMHAIFLVSLKIIFLVQSVFVALSVMYFRNAAEARRRIEGVAEYFKVFHVDMISVSIIVV